MSVNTESLDYSTVNWFGSNFIFQLYFNEISVTKILPHCTIFAHVRWDLISKFDKNSLVTITVIFYLIFIAH